MTAEGNLYGAHIARHVLALSFPPFDFAQDELRRESRWKWFFWSPACAGVTIVRIP